MNMFSKSLVVGLLAVSVIGCQKEGVQSGAKLTAYNATGITNQKWLAKNEPSGFEYANIFPVNYLVKLETDPSHPAASYRIHVYDANDVQHASELDAIEFGLIDRKQVANRKFPNWNGTAYLKYAGEALQSKEALIAGGGTLTNKDGELHPVLVILVPVEKSNTCKTDPENQCEFQLLIANLDTYVAPSGPIGAHQGGLIHGPGNK